MSLVNSRVGVRLGLGFSLLLALMVVMVVMGMMRITEIKGDLDHIVEYDVVTMNNVMEMREAVNTIAGATRNIVMFSDAESIAAESRRIDRAWEYYAATEKSLSSLVQNQALLNKVHESGAATRPLFDKVMRLVEDNQRVNATEVLLKEVQPGLASWYGAMNNVLTARERIIEENTSSAHSAYEYTLWLIGSLSIAALVLGTFIAWSITRSIVRPLRRAVEVAGAVAQGDLTQRIEVTSTDEAGQLLQALKAMNESLRVGRTETELMVKEVAAIVESAAMGDFSVRMDVTGKTGLFQQLGKGVNNLVQTCEAGLGEVVRVLGALSRGDLTERITDDFSGTFGQLRDDSNNSVEQLKRIVLQIKKSSDAITTAALQVAAGNGNLSQRTEEQASGLEEIASSMEELTSTVHQNAENAKHAYRLAQGSCDVAEQSGVLVETLVTTMSSIHESSRKIEDIISVIDGIAFQTNILALNAAVEAARAGEHGRGFAVVAAEVRSLAQRSATAAKEIKLLIGGSREIVSVGSRQVKDAADTISDVVTSVQLVASLMKDISATTLEQSTGIEQVNTAIVQMDEVTQQNAALVEEAAAAAESMREQSDALLQGVSAFKLDGAGASSWDAAQAVVPQHRPQLASPASPKPARKPAQAKLHNDGTWKEF